MQLSIKLGGAPAETPDEESEPEPKDDQPAQTHTETNRDTEAIRETDIERDRPTDEQDKPRFKAFVANLSFSTTWQELREHFADVEGVLHVDVPSPVYKTLCLATHLTVIPSRD